MFDIPALPRWVAFHGTQVDISKQLVDEEKSGTSTKVCNGSSQKIKLDNILLHSSIDMW